MCDWIKNNQQNLTFYKIIKKGQLSQINPVMFFAEALFKILKTRDLMILFDFEHFVQRNKYTKSNENEKKRWLLFYIFVLF